MSHGSPPSTARRFGRASLDGDGCGFSFFGNASSDERTSGRADGPAGGRAGSRTDGRTGRQTYGHTGIRAYRHRGMRAGTPPGGSAPRHRPRHPGAHRRSGTDHAATPLNGRHQPPAHALPRHPQGPPGRGAGPRSHAGPPRGHRGRHPNGPAADTHRARGGGRSAARGGCAAADSGIPAPAPPAAPACGRTTRAGA
ncbi:Glycosyl transferase, family 2 [Streptomyces lividans 1326]|uniref:Glycosyl transferase, family 2 n=1 Tax=Streptomyces lividans 1326 TaxID=1200984 RepID=A0A7U9DY39_STRLI|nr:Glycosyl transferase, family 2 [Streptomyces lividans 1326]